MVVAQCINESVNAYVHNIDPVLVHLGPAEIRYYGIVYVLALIAIYFILRKFAKELGLKKDGDVESIVLVVFIGMLIGARLFALLTANSQAFFHNPLIFFKVWEGGMSFFGGLVGSTLAGWLFIRKKKINFLHLADIIILPAVLALGIGRITNFINAEVVGQKTFATFCVIFPNVDCACRHPYGIYAAIYHFVIFGVLIYMFKKKQQDKWRHGIIFASFLIMYCFCRFFLDFIKEDPRWIGLTTWQFMSIAGMIIGGYMLWRWFGKKKKNKKKNIKQENNKDKENNTNKKNDLKQENNKDKESNRNEKQEKENKRESQIEKK